MHTAKNWALQRHRRVWRCSAQRLTILWRWMSSAVQRHTSLWCWTSSAGPATDRPWRCSAQRRTACGAAAPSAGQRRARIAVTCLRGTPPSTLWDPPSFHRCVLCRYTSHTVGFGLGTLISRHFSYCWLWSGPGRRLNRFLFMNSHSNSQVINYS